MSVDGRVLRLHPWLRLAGVIDRSHRARSISASMHPAAPGNAVRVKYKPADLHTAATWVLRSTRNAASTRANALRRAGGFGEHAGRMVVPRCGNTRTHRERGGGAGDGRCHPSRSRSQRPTESALAVNVIRTRENGPLAVVAELDITASATAMHLVPRNACRCGQSANKPFCDGSHNVVRLSCERRIGDA